jgi:hypothetical protein
VQEVVTPVKSGYRYPKPSSITLISSIVRFADLFRGQMKYPTASNNNFDSSKAGWSREISSAVDSASSAVTWDETEILPSLRQQCDPPPPAAFPMRGRGGEDRGLAGERAQGCRRGRGRLELCTLKDRESSRKDRGLRSKRLASLSSVGGDYTKKPLHLVIHGEPS